jgi:hypothetical protein
MAVKRVARLMGTAGPAGKNPRRWRIATLPDPKAGKQPGLVRRDITAGQRPRHRAKP